MGRIVRAAIVFAAASVVPSAALAQTPPEWSRNVRIGAPLFVTTASGDRLEGVAGSVTTDGITVATPAGVRTAAFADIVRVQRRDSVWNGVWVGAASGAAIGLVSMLTDACPDNSPGCRAEAAAMPFGGALYGALIGWGIDALVKGRTTIYDSKAAPTFSLLAGRGAVGANLAFSW